MAPVGTNITKLNIQINRAIARARTLHELASLLTSQGAYFNNVNVATCALRVARLYHIRDANEAAAANARLRHVCAHLADLALGLLH